MFQKTTAEISRDSLSQLNFYQNHPEMLPYIGEYYGYKDIGRILFVTPSLYRVDAKPISLIDYFQQNDLLSSNGVVVKENNESLVSSAWEAMTEESRAYSYSQRIKARIPNFEPNSVAFLPYIPFFFNTMEYHQIHQMFSFSLGEKYFNLFKKIIDIIHPDKIFFLVNSIKIYDIFLPKVASYLDQMGIKYNSLFLDTRIEMFAKRRTNLDFFHPIFKQKKEVQGEKPVRLKNRAKRIASIKNLYTYSREVKKFFSEQKVEMPPSLMHLLTEVGILYDTLPNYGVKKNGEKRIKPNNTEKARAVKAQKREQKVQDQRNADIARIHKNN